MQSKISNLIMKSLIHNNAGNVKQELDFMLPMPSVLIEDNDSSSNLDITQTVRVGGKANVNSRYIDEVSKISGLPTTSMLLNNIEKGVHVDFINRADLQEPSLNASIHFKWYQNSYNGFGDAGYFGREIIETGESSLSKGVAVFWTKNNVLTPKRSDMQFKKYEALQKLIDVRTDISKHRFYAFGLHDHHNYVDMEDEEDAEMMFNTVYENLLDFIERNGDVEVIHVWIQGNTEKVVNGQTIGDSNKALFNKLRVKMEGYEKGSEISRSPMFNFPYPNKRSLKVVNGAGYIHGVATLIHSLIRISKVNEYSEYYEEQYSFDNQIVYDIDEIPFQVNSIKKLTPAHGVILWNYVLDASGENPLFTPTERKVTIDKLKVTDHYHTLLHNDPDYLMRKIINEGLLEEKYAKEVKRLSGIEKFVDGDEIVEWPKAKFFWKTNNYAPFKSRDNMLSAHSLDFHEYMKVNPRHVILFNGGDDFVSKYQKQISGAIVISKQELQNNITARIADGNLKNQPVDVRESYEMSMKYKEMLPTFSSFDEIVEPGLYMAASGSGKSTYVDYINKRMKDKHVIRVNVHELVAEAVLDLFDHDVTKEMETGVDENHCLLMHLHSKTAELIQRSGSGRSEKLIKGVVIESKFDTEFKLRTLKKSHPNFDIEKARKEYGIELADTLVLCNRLNIPRYSSLTEAVQPGIILTHSYSNAEAFIAHHQIGSMRGDLKSNTIVNASYSDVVERQQQPLSDSEILTSNVISTYHFTALSGSNTLLCSYMHGGIPAKGMCVLPNTSLSGIMLEKYKSHPDIRTRAGLINESIVSMCNMLHDTRRNDFIHVSDNVRLKSMTIGEIISETDHDTYYVFMADRFFLMPVNRKNTIKFGKNEESILLDIELTTINIQHSMNCYIASWITPQPGYAGLLAMKYRTVCKIGRRVKHIMLLKALDILNASGHALASFSMEPHTFLAYIEEILTLHPNNPFTFPTNEPVTGGAFHTKDEYHAAIKFMMANYNVKNVSTHTVATIMKKTIILENVVSFM